MGVIFAIIILLAVVGLAIFAGYTIVVSIPLFGALSLDLISPGHVDWIMSKFSSYENGWVFLKIIGIAFVILFALIVLFIICSHLSCLMKTSFIIYLVETIIAVICAFFPNMSDALYYIICFLGLGISIAIHYGTRNKFYSDFSSLKQIIIGTIPCAIVLFSVTYGIIAQRNMAFTFATTYKQEFIDNMSTYVILSIVISVILTGLFALYEWWHERKENMKSSRKIYELEMAKRKNEKNTANNYNEKGTSSSNYFQFDEELLKRNRERKLEEMRKREEELIETANKVAKQDAIMQMIHQNPYTETIYNKLKEDGFSLDSIFLILDACIKTKKSEDEILSTFSPDMDEQLVQKIHDDLIS